MFPHRHYLLGLFGLAAVLGLLGLRTVPPTDNSNTSAPVPEAGPPRLAVLVFFDQLRADYLTRWAPLFGSGGFRRLQVEGARYPRCYYPYADTVTAAGHASVAAGCDPCRHGIIANDWYDRATGARVGCVSSSRYSLVPHWPSRQGKGVSPERLLQPTLADALKEATHGAGRVVALSFKDRSAVLPGGRRPDACYWFDTARGLFVTSTYYRDGLHPWVKEYNRSRAADRWYGQEWTKLRPDLDYERYSGPDDGKGEGIGIFQGRTFPHPLGGGPLGLKAVYYGALYNSPFGNDLLLGLAERAIQAERLGTHDTPDLLCLSFSCNDPVGHSWGPDSQEVLDVTLRSDRLVEQLLDYLDAQVGKGRYVLALTADHGVCPLPEVSRHRGREAERIDTGLLRQRAEEYLNRTFQQTDVGDKGTRWVEAFEGPWIYLNQHLLQRRKLEQADVEQTLAHWLEQQPGIRAAYTRTRLLKGVPADDAVGQAVARSFYPARSGDVAVVVKPYFLLSSTYRLSGTTHGTPYPYDTHVPLLVYGPGISAGVHRERITPEAVTVILARTLGIKPPAGVSAQGNRP